MVKRCLFLRMSIAGIFRRPDGQSRGSPAPEGFESLFNGKEPSRAGRCRRGDGGQLEGRERRHRFRSAQSRGRRRATRPSGAPASTAISSSSSTGGSRRRRSSTRIFPISCRMALTPRTSTGGRCGWHCRTRIPECFSAAMASSRLTSGAGRSARARCIVSAPAPRTPRTSARRRHAPLPGGPAGGRVEPLRHHGPGQDGHRRPERQDGHPRRHHSRPSSPWTTRPPAPRRQEQAGRMGRAAEPRPVQEHLYQGAIARRCRREFISLGRREGPADHRGTRTRRVVLHAVPGLPEFVAACPSASSPVGVPEGPTRQVRRHHHVQLHPRPRTRSGRKKPARLVESGRGIVVLHHSLLNYQTWNWWYQDVVGGSYTRLPRVGIVLSSTVKDGQEMTVTPADGPHPVVAGIGRVPDPSMRPTSACGSRPGRRPC